MYALEKLPNAEKVQIPEFRAQMLNFPSQYIHMPKRPDAPEL